MKIRTVCHSCGKQILLEYDEPEREEEREHVEEAAQRFSNIAVCDACADHFGPRVHVHAPKKTKVEQAVESLIPADYRNSDTSRFPTKQFAMCSEWKPGSRGLYLYGPSRRYKSRIAYWLAKRFIEQGHTAMTFDSRTFRGEVEERIVSGTLWPWYPQVERVDLFLLDDLGKFKGEGKRIEEELFNVIKGRMEAQRSVIITAQHSLEDIKYKFSADIGIPLVERLKEVCDVISFYKEGEGEETIEHKFAAALDL